MTAPFVADSTFTPGKGGLSDAWQRYLATPFVRDTLARLVGSGRMSVTSQARPPLGKEQLRGQTSGSDMRLFEAPSDELFTHELGHALEFSHAAPDVTDRVRATFERQRPPYSYAGRRTTDYDAYGRSATEYVADAFAGALASGRRGFADSTAVERKMPGAIELIRWLQTRQPFAKDSLSRDVGAALQR